MSYICTRRLRLGEKEYYQGESIPDNVFVPGRVSKLKSAGYITEADDVEPADVKMTVTVGVVALDLDQTGNPDTLCTITNEALQTAVFIMQMSASDAAMAVVTETDETVLKFIASVDSRKTVAQAARKQLAALTADSNEAPQEGGETDEQ